jgi:HSP20 family protein
MNIESPLVHLQQDIDRMFDNFLQGFNVPYARPAGVNAMISPRINITESPDSYEISAELPGVEEKDVDISLSGAVLTIKGERREEREEKERSYHRIESAYGAFQRTIALPEDADKGNINANFKNGILSIVIGKSREAQADTRKIAISKDAA